MSDNPSPKDPLPSSQIPTRQDGFNTPGKDIKKRNLITFLIILALIAIWLSIGFYKAFSGA